MNQKEKEKSFPVRNSNYMSGFSNRNSSVNKRMVLQEKWLVFGGDFKPFSVSGYNGLWSVQIENYESGKHIKKTLINRWVKKVYS